LAAHLARKGPEVRRWAYEPDVIESINTKHENVRFLRGHQLSHSIQAVGEVDRAVSGTELVTLATPSHVLRAIVRSASRSLPPSAPLEVATKGNEKKTP